MAVRSDGSFELEGRGVAWIVNKKEEKKEKT